MAEVTSIGLRQIKYDLIHDVIQGEPTPSLSNFALSRLAVSLWQKNIIGNLKQTPNVDFKHILEDFKECKDWFQQIETKILHDYQKEAYNYDPFAMKNLPQIFYGKFQEVLSKIKSNITQFSKSLGKLNVPLTFKIIEIYVRNLQLTLQGTINFQRTASYLVENSNLSTINKYAISCHYCLREKICYLLKEMSDNFIKDFNFNENFRLMVYWTYYFQNNLDELEDIALWWYPAPTLGVCATEYLISMSIMDGNEVAVQSIWQNFKSLDVSPYLSSLYCVDSKSVNLWCYYISQLNSYEEVERLYISNGYRLLTLLASDSRWRSHFFTSSNYVLGYLNRMEPYAAIKTVIVSSLYNKSNRGYYCKLMEEYSLYYSRSEISFQTFIFSSKTILRMILAIDSDMDLINFLLNFKSNIDMECLFDNETYLFELIDGLFQTEKLYLLKDFINEIFTESIAEMFLNCFVKKLNIKFCSKFLRYEHFAKMADTFFILSCGESGLASFKSGLPFKEDGKIIGDILKSNSFEKVPLITKFLNWCFDGNEERIFNCKKNLFDIEDHSNRYCNIQLLNQLQSLIKLKHFKALKLHLKWAGIPEIVFKNICEIA